MKTSPNETDIDQILGSYFRREMPSRWPAAPEAEVTTAAKHGWTLATSRFLVGMSLVALLAAYMGLATFFPRDTNAGLNPNGSGMIGHKPGVGKNAPTPPVAESRP